MRALATILMTTMLALTAAAPAAAQQDIEHVLVIPVNIAGWAPLAIDRDQIADALFGQENSVASRYRVISYGKLAFAGSTRDIADPVTLPPPSDFCDSGLGHIASAAKDAVSRRGTLVMTYQHFVFVMPKITPCGWIGLADIGGDRVWVKATTAKALEHELGHNLGMDHAVGWHDKAAEGSDFMGSGTASLNAPHVVQMGWLKDFPGKVVELAAAADVTLEALEADPAKSNLPKVVLVRPQAGGNTYYLSYRATSAANPLPDLFMRGLNIHIFDPTRRTGGLTYFVTSLTDGTSFDDGRLEVRQAAHTPAGTVTIHVDFNGTGGALLAGPPPAEPGTMQSLASGKCLDLPGGRTTDGTLPIQYDCHGGLNQQWTLEAANGAGTRIVSRLSGKCLGTSSRSRAGGGISQSPCEGSPQQLWTREDVAGGSVLRNVANGLCLDVPGASTANGAQPITWTCNGGTNQVWRYVPPGAL